MYRRFYGSWIKANIQELVKWFSSAKSSHFPQPLAEGTHGHLWSLSVYQSSCWPPVSSVSQVPVTHFRVHAGFCPSRSPASSNICHTLSSFVTSCSLAMLCFLSAAISLSPLFPASLALTMTGLLSVYSGLFQVPLNIFSLFFLLFLFVCICVVCVHACEHMNVCGCQQVRLVQNSFLTVSPASFQS